MNVLRSGLAIVLFCFALVPQTKAASQEPVCISEIMYNPPGGDAYEFIELHNAGSAAVNLSGMSFEGVDFRFPEGTPLLGAGANLVVGSDVNPALFSQRYPGIIIAGRFGGNLANGGERLALKDRNSRTIISVDYDDEGAWPAAPDGGGHSLEIINLNGDPDDPANWRASAQTGGSPGAVNPEVPSASVRLNEIMAENVSAVKNGEAYPDWIELHNGGGSTVNLAGWSLSDGSNPRKYVFPSEVNLPAGGYLVVWADDLTNSSGLHTGFALGKTGETVLLFDSQTNRVDAISFGPQLADYSIGRVGPGTGAWELTMPTPGGPNEAAILGASTNLVINEFLANPAAGGEDWIELFNKSKDLPIALRGTYLSTSSALFQLRSLSFIPPGGFVQLFADEKPGADHLDFKLPAAGGIIVVSDESGIEIDRIDYGTQPEGVSMGRLPDGSDNLVSFPSSASPGASNYVAAVLGPQLNEVLARNESLADPSGEINDWVELYNPNATAFDLSGMTLSVDANQPGQWSFPAGTTIAARGYLLLRGDGSRAASTKFESPLDLGRSLANESGGVYLFNAGGQAVDHVEYGFQLPDLSIGRSGNTWILLARPTPGAANASAVALGNSANLWLNEWLANPTQGDDWFEIYNLDSLPVHLGGLYLTDDPSVGGQTKFQIPPLSFGPGHGWVLYQASGQTDQGRNHVNFTLDEQGGTLRIFSSILTLIDSIDFISQAPDASEGRLPDGGVTIVPFPNSPTPGEANFLPLTNVVINEALTHTDPPLEDAIELYNPSSQPVDVGGWFLSNTPDNLKKFRIPAGSIIPSKGYKVLYEYQFNPDPDSPDSFTLNSAHGDDVNLSSADALGNLTGYRSRQKFGAAENGVSFGRFRTSVGVDFVALSQRSFGIDDPATLVQFRRGTGKPNPYPRVGPVVINEIMYHPVTIVGTNATENTDEEFIELHNITPAPAALFDPNNPNNTWKLANAIDFVFPKNVTIGSGGYVLVVGFDPGSDTTALAAFQAKYKIPPSVRIFGPYQGKLANDRDTVELLKPDPPQLPPHPDAGFVPYVLVDRIDYADVLPWPPQADGAGASLQRRQPTLYGNDPAAWRAADPTAGAANPVGASDEDADGLPDEWEIANGLNPNDPSDPESDPDGDGLTSRQEFYAGTDPRDPESTLAIKAFIPAGTAQLKILLRFGVVAGKTYTVEFQDHLGNGSWEKLATLEAQPSTGDVDVIDSNPNTSGSRFYRLVTPKKP